MRTLLPLLLLAACVAPDGGTTKAPADSANAGTDSAGGDSGKHENEDTALDSGADSGGQDTDEPPAEIVRFVALGDAGEGNTEQYQVADAIAVVCARDGCDFALYLGDNFYDTGVAAVDDAQFDEKFELPYAELDFPFYPVLGNHDYGGEGIGWELWKGSIYVDYSVYSDKWTMPDLYYDHTHAHATFLGLDTTQVFWGFGDAQELWMRDQVAAAAGSTWVIAYGHHPYLSNGPHGNAGEYEGLDWVPIVNGAAVEDFVDSAVCGDVDVYINGHDHSMQWPEGTCGTEFIVSGAGAKTTELEGSNPTWFESDLEGFLWVELRDRTFTGVFYDLNGTELYRRSFTK